VHGEFLILAAILRILGPVEFLRISGDSVLDPKCVLRIAACLGLPILEKFKPIQGIKGEMTCINEISEFNYFQFLGHKTQKFLMVLAAAVLTLAFVGPEIASAAGADIKMSGVWYFRGVTYDDADGNKNLHDSTQFADYQLRVRWTARSESSTVLHPTAQQSTVTSNSVRMADAVSGSASTAGWLTS
jgi:hypothetical protein